MRHIDACYAIGLLMVFGIFGFLVYDAIQAHVYITALVVLACGAWLMPAFIYLVAGTFKRKGL